MWNLKPILASATCLLLVGCTQAPTKLSSSAQTELTAQNQWKSDVHSGQLITTVSLVPRGPNDNSLIVQLKDQSGNPLSDASVTATTAMSSMNMAGPSLQAKTIGPGTYRMDSNLMPGDWKIDLAIQAKTGTEQLDVNATVPQSTASAGSTTN